MGRIPDLKITPERVALAALLAHSAWALWIGVRHPGLGYEADRVANWLYFQTLVSGDLKIGELWYFPAPKVLLVLLLGPLGDGPAEMLLVAAAAGCLAATATWIVAASFGAAAGAATTVVIAMDPRWTELVAIASADLFVAAGVAAAVCAWCARCERLAALMIVLVTLVKPPAALTVVPLLLERGRSGRARFCLVAGATLGLGATAAGYALLLGSLGTPTRFLEAYMAVRAEAPTVLTVLGTWIVDDIGGLLPWAWPLVPVGLVAALRKKQAGPMRQWLAAATGVAAGFTILAAATGTLLFARFLWSLELCALALCATGAVLAGRGIARLIAARGVARTTGTVATAVLLAVVVGGLAQSSTGAAGRYVVLFEHGARTAIPWLQRLAAQVTPGDRVVVPLWFQPAAIWALKQRLPPAAVEAAEVRVASGRGRANHPAPDWLLFAPHYLENPAAIRWTVEASACGYQSVSSSELPRMSLLHRRSNGHCSPPG